MPYSSDVAAAEALTNSYSKLKQEISKVVIGQDDTVRLLLTAIFCQGHCLLVGVPGLAKTLLIQTIAGALDLDFNRIQFTPDLMPSDILGSETLDQERNFKFIKGPVFANIILADEINRTPPKTQSALLEAMQEYAVTIAGQKYGLGRPFFVLATQNPIEQEGTYPLPEAQLDRFLFKIVVGYPAEAEEVDILRGHHQRRSAGHRNLGDALDAVSAVLTAEQLATLRGQVHQVHVEDKLFNYMAQIVQATRANKSLYLGASPRASVALLNSAKALATLRGRDFITPEDVQELAAPVLRHRVLLTPEREMEGGTADDVVAQLVQKIEVPR